jgi:hypothetical protein
MDIDEPRSKHKRSRKEDPDRKGKKRSKRAEEDSPRKHKKSKTLRIVDDDPDDDELWVEKNIDMDGERVSIDAICLTIAHYSSSL